MALSRLFLPLALLLVAAPPTLAQPAPPSAALRGLVLDDATGEPIPSATITLYQGADTTFVTGTITDAEGAFSLEPLRPGDYAVRVSFIGYATQTLAASVRPGPPTDLGTIRLAESAAEQGEAEVRAQRELVEQRADRTVYNMAHQPVTASTASATPTSGRSRACSPTRSAAAPPAAPAAPAAPARRHRLGL